MSGYHRYAQIQGDPGTVLMYVAYVTPGQQIPVIVGQGGAGGVWMNVNSWRDGMNGHDGGASSFAGCSAPGGSGGKLLSGTGQLQTTVLVGGYPSWKSGGCVIYREFANDLSARLSADNGWVTCLGFAGAGGFPGLSCNNGAAGSNGFVGVYW